MKRTTTRTAKTTSPTISFEGEMTETATLPPATIPPAIEGGLSGDWDSGDIRLPKLELKHPVDTRYSDVPGGAFVYSTSADTYLTLTAPVPVIFLSANKGYMEVTEQGVIPNICRSKAELAEVGGTTERERPDASLYQPFCDTTVLVGREAHATWPGVVLLDICGEKFAPATYRAKGTAFKEVGSAIAGYEVFQKMGGNQSARLFDVRWSLGSILRKGQTFSYFVPTLKQKLNHSAAQIAALRDMAVNL